MSHPDSPYSVRPDLETLVLRALREDHGPDAVIRRPLVSASTGQPYGIEETVPADPLAALAVASRIADTAAALTRRWALQARATGTSWTDVAAALRIEPYDDDPAVTAFERVAGTRGFVFGPLSCSWRCTACGQIVTDHGPYGGHPDDTETGHTDTCPRHLADIDAYLADL